MRLITWNARRGPFARKAPLLEPLMGNLVVVTEIAKPAETSDRLLWFGESPARGVAVIARGPYTLQRGPELENVPKYIIPVHVEGPESFLLFAVWTLAKQRRPYVQAACTAISMYSDLFREGPVVMLGDFNSNTQWDAQHPAELNHTSLVGMLNDHGLVSAYHHVRSVDHGGEAEPTFYLYGHEDRPYHLDYCFLPLSWVGRLKDVTVGSFADWRAHSDHRPLIVTVADESSP